MSHSIMLAARDWGVARSGSVTHRRPPGVGRTGPSELVAGLRDFTTSFADALSAEEDESELIDEVRAGDRLVCTLV